MPLTDTAIRNAKPGAKPVKLFDERGLFLLVSTAPGKNKIPQFTRARRSNERPMSDNAILAAMPRMGIAKDEMSGH